MNTNAAAAGKRCRITGLVIACHHRRETAAIAFQFDHIDTGMNEELRIRAHPVLEQ